MKSLNYCCNLMFLLRVLPEHKFWFYDHALLTEDGVHGQNIIKPIGNDKD